MKSHSLTLGILAAVVFSAAGSARADSHDHPCKLDGLAHGKVAITDDGDVSLLDGDKLVAHGTLTLPYNEAKAEITCAGQRIEIYAQTPFSAAALDVTLQRKGADLVVTTDDSGDTSASALARIERLLKTGRVEDAVAALGSLDVPEHTFDEPKMAVRILLRAHDVAVKRHKAGEARTAADALKAGFSYYRTTPGAAIKAKKLLGIQSDYGLFLEEAGDHVQAESELAAVVKADPKRAETRLALADALWAQGKQHEAMVEYEAYAKLVPRKLHPPRVGERLKGVS